MYENVSLDTSWWWNVYSKIIFTESTTFENTSHFPLSGWSVTKPAPWWTPPFPLSQTRRRMTRFLGCVRIIRKFFVCFFSLWCPFLLLLLLLMILTMFIFWVFPIVIFVPGIMALAGWAPQRMEKMSTTLNGIMARSGPTPRRRRTRVSRLWNLLIFFTHVMWRFLKLLFQGRMIGGRSAW